MANNWRASPNCRPPSKSVRNERWYSAFYVPANHKTSRSPLARGPEMSRLSEFSDELESLVESSAPSVVAVEHGHGQGSGIIVSGDGYVVTNAHVVHGRAGVLSVRLAGGEELRAEVVGEDHASDLAVLRVGARG